MGRQQAAAENLIPVGNITVDCTPATFESPGMTRTMISCVVDQVVVVPITRKRKVQIPLPGGCYVWKEIVETIKVPVLTTVNVPGVLTKIPTIVCPSGATSPA